MTKKTCPLPMGKIVYSTKDKKVGKVNGFIESSSEIKIRFSPAKYDYSYRKIKDLEILK